MPDRAADEALSAHLRKSGVVTDEQLWSALKEQSRLAEKGEDLPLGAVLVRLGVLSVAQRESLEAKLRQSQHLGPYKIVRKLGEGGMGAVYLCADPFTHGKVAIKVLPKVAANDEDALRRFMREVESAQKLQHRNIVLAYGSGEDRGFHYFVMEYVEGETLGARIKREEALSPDDATKLILQVAQGLRYAHDLGIVHRDIKPDNLVVTPEGVAKILDMGLSKNIEDVQAFRTVTGVALGTPHYMAPEQARGGKIDGRADLYSLGATYYHLLTGETPFHGATAVELIAQHVNKQLPDPRDIRDGIPDSVVHVLRRMMAKKPEDRYRESAELIADLELVQRGASPSSQALAAEHSSVALPMRQEARERYRAERQKARSLGPARDKKGTYRIPHATKPGGAPMVVGVAAIAAALLVALILALSGGSKPEAPPLVAPPSRATPLPPIARSPSTKLPDSRMMTPEERREAEAARKLDEIQEVDKSGRFAADELRRRYEEFARAYIDTPQGRTIADWLASSQAERLKSPAPKPEAPAATAIPPPNPEPEKPAPTEPAPLPPVIAPGGATLQAAASAFSLVPPVQGRHQANESRLAIHSNGRAEARLAVPAPGTYDILVTTSSSAVRGEFAKFRVLVDGVVVGSDQAAGSIEPATYKVSTPLQEGERVFALQFLNDLFDRETNEDRNLFVHSLALVPLNPPPAPAIVRRRGLVGHWSFDEITGKTVPDSSGRGHKGELQGSPTWAAGKHGGALAFDGKNAQVAVPDHEDLRISGDLTIALWARFTSIPADAVRLVGRGDSNSRNYGIWTLANKHLLFQQYGETGGSVVNVEGRLPLSTETWYHVAAVVKGDQATVYLDGAVHGTATRSGIPGTVPAPLTFGCGPMHSRLDGMLDDVWLFDRALEPVEIARLMKGVADAPAARAAVPAGAAQSEAMASLRKSFKVDQAKTAAEKSDLAKTILQSAVAAEVGEADLYARLKLARDLATETDDVETAIWAVEEMAARFDVVALAEKANLLTKTQVRGSDAAPWALKCLETADEAVAADEFESAVRLATRAETLARTANDPTLHADAKERLKEMQEIKREADNLKARFAALKANPEDPASNSAVGKFACLLKGDWEGGLAMLAKGSDTAYRKLAELELADPADAKERAALGDAWAAQGNRESAAYKARARARAASWLERALAGLTGFDKLDAEKKLATLAPPEAAVQVDLLRLVDLQKDVIAGVWRRVGATLVTPQAAESKIEELGRIVIPYIPPEEYDLAMTVTLLDESRVNSASLDVALPALGARVLCVTDAGKGSHSSMLYNLDGKGLQNETTHTKRVFAKGRTRALTYSVRKGSVTALADGVPYIRWSGDFKRFPPPDSTWTFTTNGAFAIGAWTTYQVSRITLTPVSGGRGRPLR